MKQQTGSSQVDIVNHSMGGLVSLWYVKQLGGASSVRRLASIAGANHGTTCLTYTTCQQMYPGSSFITPWAAATRPRADDLRHLVLALRRHHHPYTSTALSGATNHLVACQTHIGYLTDTATLTAVRSFLTS